MSTIRYLFDENVEPFYRSELFRREPGMTIWQVGILGAPPKGTLDPDILRYSMPQHLREHLAESRHLPGIIELNPNLTIGETLDALLLIWGASQTEEYADRIVFLPMT